MKQLAALLAAVGVLLVLPPCGVAAAVRLVPLQNLPLAEMVPGSITASRDGQTVALIVRQDGGQAVLTNGHRRGAVYDRIASKALELSDRGGHVGYWAARGDRLLLVLDESEKLTLPKEEHLGDLSDLWVSQDGGLIATCWKDRRGNTRLYRSDRTGEPESLSAALVKVTEAGLFCFTVDEQAKSWRVTLGDREVYRATNVPYSLEFRVTQDGQHWAAIARGKSGPAILLDGMEKWSANAVGNMRQKVTIFGRDGNLAETDFGQFMTGERFGDLSLSEDGHHVAFWATQRSGRPPAESSRQQWFATLDGKRVGPTWEGVRPDSLGLWLTPDGKHLLYPHIDAGGESCSLYYDGAVVAHGPSVPLFPAFSPDSARYAYVALVSSDGKDMWRPVVDGKEGPLYDACLPVVFSPNSRHYCYLAVQEGKHSLVVDGEMVAEGTYISPPSFQSDGTLRCLVQKDDQVYWAEMRGAEPAAPVPARPKGQHPPKK